MVLDADEQVGGFISDIIYGISDVLMHMPYVVETASADSVIIART